jgi:hypothetical protein
VPSSPPISRSAAAVVVEDEFRRCRSSGNPSLRILWPTVKPSPFGDEQAMPCGAVARLIGLDEDGKAVPYTPLVIQAVPFST